MTGGDVGAGDNDRTLHTYEAFVSRYIDRSAQTASPLAAVLAAELPPGSHVLEIGSGGGWDAIALEEAGFLVDRTDAAAGFVERLQRLGFPARALNALTDDLGGPYDAVYASAVFLHFSRGELAHVLTAALDAIRPGGVLAATLKKGQGEEWSRRKMDAPRYFHYWQEQDLADLLQACGWDIIRLEETTPPRTSERWITALARRPRS